MMVSGGGYYRQVLYELTTVWLDPGDGAFQNLLEKKHILKLIFIYCRPSSPTLNDSKDGEEDEGDPRKFDSTGMFHWCPEQPLSTCLVVSTKYLYSKERKANCELIFSKLCTMHTLLIIRTDFDDLILELG